MRIKVVFLGILLATGFLGLLCFPKDYGLSVKCVKVIDGDTFIAKTFLEEFRVRLLYIDAPEMDQKKFGTLSKKALKKLIEGKNVILNQRKKDFYGRTLSEVYLGEENINLRMVKSGMAFLYRFNHFKNKKKESEYEVNLYKAKLKRLGIFNENVMEPYLFRKMKKSRDK